MIRKLIIEALHQITTDKQTIHVPQDYSQEFNQTGSGKPIQGRPNIAKAQPYDIQALKMKIKEAILVANDYRNAFANGLPDEKGNINFQTVFNGQKYDCVIPPQFKLDKSHKGESVNYLYYFNVPEAGDGAMQVALDKTGRIKVNNLRSKADMDTNPDLSAAADAGYSKDFDGRIKYFSVKAGVAGKFQQETPRYSVFPSPAFDALIKAYIAYRHEMIDFMMGGADYTSDNKGQDLSNKMDFPKKLEKIRKDAENIIGKPISSNADWLKWKEQLLLNMDTPEKQTQMDVNQMTQDFVNLYQSKNIKKPAISMSGDELADFERKEKEKAARLAMAKQRKNR